MQRKNFPSLPITNPKLQSFLFILLFPFPSLYSLHIPSPISIPGFPFEHIYQIMELSSYTTESASVRGYKKSSEASKTEQDSQTEDITYSNRGMNTRPLLSKETQFSRKIRVKESTSVEEFLKKVEPLMVKELEKTSKAFQCKF